MNEAAQWNYWNKAASWSLLEAFILISGNLPWEPWGAIYHRDDQRIIGEINNEAELLQTSPEYQLAACSIMAGDIDVADYGQQKKITPFTYIKPDSFIQWAKKQGIGISEKISRNLVQSSNTDKKKRTKQSRAHALHIELENLFVEWEKPETNKECWSKLKNTNWDERDNSVIQEVSHCHNDRDKCKILWRSPTGKERFMKRCTFDNVIGKIRDKFHG